MTTTNLEFSAAAEKRKRISYGLTLLATGLFIFFLFGLNTRRACRPPSA
ncbi:MAG: hypothetical protein HND47_01145 [Chloroflexi bacterium]|nr:hypothetical protein [Chloroflexota bacterium]